MTNFERVPSQYDAIPELLLGESDGFRRSPEFAEVTEFLDLPGIVVAAFARYVQRLERARHRGEKNAQLDDAYNAIETLAGTGDPSVENALWLEFFDNLEQRARAAVARRLGPSATARYENWAKVKK